MIHNITNDLKWRHTVKKYDRNKKIPQEHLDVLFESMRLSASSINSQPWKFIVISSDKAKKRMYDTFANKYQFNQTHIYDSSQIILFAHNPKYTKEDYAKVVDKGIEDGRIQLSQRDSAFGAFVFAQMNTDDDGNTSSWTKAQLYLALGNTLHTLARLKIGSTSLEGIDSELVNAEFEEELDGYTCEVALAIGYSDEKDDYNSKLPKSRKNMEDIFVHI